MLPDSVKIWCPAFRYTGKEDNSQNNDQNKGIAPIIKLKGRNGLRLSHSSHSFMVYTLKKLGYINGVLQKNHCFLEIIFRFKH